MAVFDLKVCVLRSGLREREREHRLDACAEDSERHGIVCVSAQGDGGEMIRQNHNAKCTKLFRLIEKGGKYVGIYSLHRLELRFVVALVSRLIGSGDVDQDYVVLLQGLECRCRLCFVVGVSALDTRHPISSASPIMYSAAAIAAPVFP